MSRSPDRKDQRQERVTPAQVRRASKGDTMAATVLYMSMSLDGFIAGPNAGPGNGLGDGGHRPHEGVFTGAAADPKAISDLGGVNGQVVDEVMATGAVVAGRGTFEPAGGWGGDHHDGVPIYILSRNPAPDWAGDL